MVFHIVIQAEPFPFQSLEHFFSHLSATLSVQGSINHTHSLQEETTKTGLLFLSQQGTAVMLGL